MGWFSFLKNSPEKTISDITDKDNGLLVQAGGWINDLQYTEQEKAKDLSAMAKGVTEFVSATLSENSERSKTRRSLAVGWMQLQIFLVLITVATAPFKLDLAKFFWEVATSQIMMIVTGGIVVFFFGAYSFGAHILPKKVSGK